MRRSTPDCCSRQVQYDHAREWNQTDSVITSCRSYQYRMRGYNCTSIQNTGLVAGGSALHFRLVDQRHQREHQLTNQHPQTPYRHRRCPPPPLPPGLPGLCEWVSALPEAELQEEFGDELAEAVTAIATGKPRPGPYAVQPHTSPATSTHADQNTHHAGNLALVSGYLECGPQKGTRCIVADRVVIMMTHLIYVQTHANECVLCIHAHAQTHTAGHSVLGQGTFTAAEPAWMVLAGRYANEPDAEEARCHAQHRLHCNCYSLSIALCLSLRCGCFTRLGMQTNAPPNHLSYSNPPTNNQHRPEGTTVSRCWVLKRHKAAADGRH